MQKIIHRVLIIAAGTFILASCVPTRKFNASQAALQSVRGDSAALATKVADQQSTLDRLKQEIADQQNKIAALNSQIADLNNQTGQLSTDAANKESQLTRSRQELARLQDLMNQQRRATQEIRKRMSDALVGFNSNELTVSVKNGKVYVSMQESLLFPIGSAVVSTQGKLALSKLADALNKDTSITVDIEGHTDSIPIHGRYMDNWDLSTARANSIVRILTKTYAVDPIRVIASGHSKYDPVESNSTPAGRALNRRTEVILSPNLDELYKILETGGE